MEKEVLYIPYGTDEIDYNQFIQNSANEVQSFVNSQPWSNKRKQSFLNAYQDIVSKGITGAFNTTGVWTINHKGDPIDLDSKSQMDRDMYGAAADFIQKQMAKIPARKPVVEENKELPVFNNEYFTFQLNNQIGKEFGGRDWSRQEWNDFDARGENGLRGTQKRAEKLAKILETYANSLQEGQHSFKDSPFENLEDFKTKVNTAINTLRTGTPDQFKDVLNPIGLRYEDFFNDGSGDIRETLDDGTQITYGQYNEDLANQAKQKGEQALQQQQIAQQKRNKWINDNRFNIEMSSVNMLGQDLKSLGAKYNNTQTLIQKLNEYTQKGLSNLSPEEASELVGAFRYGSKQPISNDLHTLIKYSSPAYRNSRITDFEQIPGVEGAVWHKPTGRVLNLRSRTQEINNDFLKGYSKEAQDLLKRTAAKDRKFLSSFRESNGARYTDPDGSYNITTGAKDLFVDAQRAQALMADLGSVVASFLPGYGTAASAVLGIGGLASELLADVADEGVSWGEVGERLLSNAGFVALGLLPGGKLGKIGSKLVKYGLPMAGAVFSTMAGKQMLEDPEFRKSWNKLLDGKFDEINGGDAQNYVKFLGIAAGLTSGGRAAYSNFKYGRLAAGSPKTTIKTNKGEIPATKEQVAKINEIGNTKGNPAANKYLNEQIVKDANAGHEVTVDFKPGKLRSIGGKYNPLRKKVETSTTYERTPSEQRVIDNYRKKSEAMHRGEGIYRFAPKSIIRDWMPTDYDMYFGRRPFYGFRQQNLNEKPSKEISSPQNRNASKISIPAGRSNEEGLRIIPSSIESFRASGPAPIKPIHNKTKKEYRVENKKLYRDIDKKGKFTNNVPEEGTFTFKDNQGNTHTFRLIQRDDDFLLDVKSSNGTSRQTSLTLDQVKQGIWNNIKQSLNTGLKSNISLPANIIRILQGTSYGWLKQGGTINNIDNELKNAINELNL